MANERNELISSDRCRYSVNVLDNIEREMGWMGGWVDGNIIFLYIDWFRYKYKYKYTAGQKSTSSV